MGGLIFMLASAVALVAAVLVSQFFLPIKLFSDSWSDAAKTKLVAGVLLALCSGGIGFLDDYIKVVKKRNLGLTSIQKLLAQLLVGAGYAVSVYMSGGTAVEVPFIGLVDFGIWFIPFAVFVVVAALNAVNLTDGIDGLCGSVSLIVCLFFLTVSGQYIGQGLTAAAVAGGLWAALAAFLKVKYLSLIHISWCWPPGFRRAAAGRIWKRRPCPHSPG